MASTSVAFCETRRGSLVLLVLGVFSFCGYAALCWLSWQFVDGLSDKVKPTMPMLAIFAFEFVCYWAALWLVVRLQPTKWLLWGILGGACLFRAILLPSVPMHEIDFYRYVWDGAVLAKGMSPYHYSPHQVRVAAQDVSAIQEEELHALVMLRGRSKSLAYSLDQIHFGELSSPYPPVSQAVFALAAIVTPDEASSYVRIVIMKSLLVLFDLATLLVVIALLRETGLPIGLSIAYGWCPLVLKEFANGGHLDSIAIFFSTLAVLLLIRCGKRIEKQLFAAITSGAILALAVGAKIYPVILLPLFAAVWWRRGSIRVSFWGILATVIPIAVLVWPMFSFLTLDNRPPTPELPLHAETTVSVDASSFKPSTEPLAGLQEFLKHWEMNDLIFMVVQENLCPQTDVAAEFRPWFVVVPDTWSTAIIAHARNLEDWVRATSVGESPLPAIEPQDTDQDFGETSFLLARILTLGCFSLFACWLAWRSAAEHDPCVWCRSAMLTLAWFWLTCPTQNPWYWCWVLPFLPFAKYRTWYLLAGCSMLYYLRFWLLANFLDPPVLGTPYNGEYFFYFVVVWIEFAPCLLFLGFETFLSRQERLKGTNALA